MDLIRPPRPLLIPSICAVMLLPTRNPPCHPPVINAALVACLVLLTMIAAANIGAGRVTVIYPPCHPPVINATLVARLVVVTLIAAAICAGRVTARPEVSSSNCRGNKG